MRIVFGIPLLFVSACALGGLAGCSGSDGPGGPQFEVSFESSARSAQAVRVEVYLVDDCAGVTLGERPVPAMASGYALRDGAMKALDTLPEPGEYGLYGVAQDARCAVVAAGCVPVTIGAEPETLSVTLGSLQAGGCPVDEVCALTTGECVDGAGGSGGSGGAGGTGGDPLERVEAGLLVLYDFDQGSGTTVPDRSGVAPTLDLTIANPRNVTWGAGFLSVDSATVISSGVAATKVFSAAAPSNEITLEAWVKPASLTPVGLQPDRIVSMSVNASERNFLLGQEGSEYAARYRTPGEDNGSPTVYSDAASVSVALQHVVFVRNRSGDETFYVDGVARGTSNRPGDSSTWDASYPLVIANEANGERDWLGELHLVAIYDRALSEAEVEQNFTVGP